MRQRQYPKHQGYDNKISRQQTFSLSKFYCRDVSHEKKRFGQFSSLPPCPHPPLKSANFIYIVVSVSLISLCVYLGKPFKLQGIRPRQYPNHQGYSHFNVKQDITNKTTNGRTRSMFRCFFTPPSMRNGRSQISAISMVSPQILVDFQSISCHFQSVSVSFSQF